MNEIKNFFCCCVRIRRHISMILHFVYVYFVFKFIINLNVFNLYHVLFMINLNFA